MSILSISEEGRRKLQYSDMLYTLQTEFRWNAANFRQKSRCPSRAKAGPGKTFSRGPSREKIFEFFSLKQHILVCFIFLSDGGPSNVAGPEVTYPPTYSTLSTGLQKKLRRLKISIWLLHFPRMFFSPDCFISKRKFSNNKRIIQQFSNNSKLKRGRIWRSLSPLPSHSATTPLPLAFWAKSWHSGCSCLETFTSTILVSQSCHFCFRIKSPYEQTNGETDGQDP